jgi:hypothetical protein
MSSVGTAGLNKRDGEQAQTTMRRVGPERYLTEKRNGPCVPSLRFVAIRMIERPPRLA